MENPSIENLPEEDPHFRSDGLSIDFLSVLTKQNLRGKRRKEISYYIVTVKQIRFYYQRRFLFEVTH